MIGPLTASVVILLAPGFSSYPHGWALAAFLGAYGIFQDYVLSPHLMSSGMELHPLLVVFGVFAGEQIAGIPGAFLSVPVMAILRMIYGRLEQARLRQVVTVEEAAQAAKGRLWFVFADNGVNSWVFSPKFGYRTIFCSFWYLTDFRFCFIFERLRAKQFF